METVFPLVAEYHAAVIVISNDESGISQDPKVRFEVAKRIVARAESYGIPREDILIDPLVMPAGAVAGAGAQVLQIVRWVNEELGCNTVCGASNVSFGLPDREAVNANFLAMLIAAGMTSAITNPLKAELEEGDPGRRHADGPRRRLHALAALSAPAGKGGSSRCGGRSAQ